MWNLLATLGAKLIGKVLPDRSENNKAQHTLNAKEIEGAPPSKARNWRAYLGLSLTLLFVWEVGVIRIVVPLWFPEKQEQFMAVSQLDHIMTLLLGLLGIGF